MKGLTDGETSDLVKLGDMIGDGLADEKGGAWIKKEYKRIVDKLKKSNPDWIKAQKEGIDFKMEKLLENFKCVKCGSGVKQVRSGSWIAKCLNCSARFKATK